MARVIDTNINCNGHLDDLKKRGVEFVGRYYAARGDKRLTQTEARALSDAGLKLFIVYEDSGSPALTVDRGRNDGQVALRQARYIGQPKGSAIYFALEHLPDGYGPEHVPGIKLYFEGIRRTFAEEYAVGCYANGSALAALLDAKLIQYAWLSASMGFHGSREFLKTDRWHLLQETPLDQNWHGLSVDTNRVQHEEFGAWSLPPAAMPEIATAVTANVGSTLVMDPAAVSLTPGFDMKSPAPETAPEPRDTRRTMSWLNEMIDEGSRLGKHLKDVWTAIKLAFGIGAGTTAAVATGAQMGLVDPSKGNAAVATSWGAQHPWLMLLIGMVLVAAVLGGILAIFFPKIIKGAVSAYKDGRYFTRGQPVPAAMPAPASTGA